MPHTLEQCELGLKFIKQNCPIDIINCGNSPMLGPSRKLEDVLNDIDFSFLRSREEYVRQLLASP